MKTFLRAPSLLSLSTVGWLVVAVQAAVPPTLSSPVVVSTGLKNLGNTCYLNAQLQCAFHIPQVRNLILEEQEEQPQEPFSPDQEEDEAKEEDDEPSSPLPRVETNPGLLALRHVFRNMLVQAGSGPCVSPQVLAVALGIPVMEQQDSQEFWKLLLPALQVPALIQLYQGEFEDYIVALDGSGREKRRPEAFLDLSLTADSGSVPASLHQLFGQPELLSVAEGNGWRPEKGADKVDAHKGSQLLPKGLPSILQLHLKRFNFDWNRNVMEKINNPLSFPSELDLGSILQSKNDDDDDKDASDTTPIYDLQSVVIHAGEFGIGHYYSYVKPDVNTDTWYRFNDDVVTEVSFEEVMADATGGRYRPSNHTPTKKETNKKPCWWGRIKGLFHRAASPPPFGFGGPTSNAYVLQYVRRSDVPTLYCQAQEEEGSSQTKD